MSETSIDYKRFIGRFSIGRDSNPRNTTGSPHFLRVKVPGGTISADQLEKVAELTETYSKGKAEITNRQSIQLHWIEAEDTPILFNELDQLGFSTDMCGQGFGGARYGDVRNIVCCPTSGIDENEVIDSSHLALQLTDFFVGNNDFLDMPRKLKISVSGCGSDCTRAWINDLAFIGVKKGDKVGYTALIGGGIGNSLPGPRLAKLSKLFIYPDQAFSFTVALAEIHRDYSSRESKSKARMKWLLEEKGLTWFLKKIEEKTEESFETYNGPIFTVNGDHSGTRPQIQRGLNFVNVPLVNGRITSKQMKQFAEYSRLYGSGELRLTPTQNIIIPNIAELDPLKSLLQSDYKLNGPAMKWTSIACSSDFCGKSLEPHSKQMLRGLSEHLDGVFTEEELDTASIKIQISGCPNNCCPPNIAEIGLSGKQVTIDGEPRQVYDILLGGGLGRYPSIGWIFKKNVEPEKIKELVVSVIEYYQRSKKPGELFKDFCNRNQGLEILNIQTKEAD